jgi:hypothetical protein
LREGDGGGEEDTHDHNDNSVVAYDHLDLGSNSSWGDFVGYGRLGGNGWSGGMKWMLFLVFHFPDFF